MALTDHMLLALPSPVKYPFEQRSVSYGIVAARDHNRIPALLSTPPPERAARAPGTVCRATVTKMATPHRSLPPPAPLQLPEPSRLQPPASSQQSLGLQSGMHGMPAPPPQWPGMEEAMRNWLATKSEEERRRQEEERTRQETLRLEQRKIEQSMLLEVIRHQVPFNLIPIIFLTLGNASSSSTNSELLQQSINQLVGNQISMLPTSPESSRERHGVYQGGHSVPPTPLEGPYSSHSARGGTMSGPPSAQRSHFSSIPPRMKASEMSSGVVPSQMSTQNSEQAPILFHHWQPPSSSNESAGPPPQLSGNAVTASDHASSPKKRKAPGPHQPAPMPPSTLRFSEVSEARRTHTRHQSDASSRAILHPSEDKHHARPRADTAMNEDGSFSEQHWQSHRYQTSPTSQSNRLQHAEASFGEISGNFGSRDNSKRRSSQQSLTAGSGSTRRSPDADMRSSRLRGDVEMLER